MTAPGTTVNLQESSQIDEERVQSLIVRLLSCSARSTPFFFALNCCDNPHLPRRRKARARVNRIILIDWPIDTAMEHPQHLSLCMYVVVIVVMMLFKATA
jgi:hypothetical protein